MGSIALPIADPEFVKRLIPQRWPIIMVDRLVSFSDKEITSGLTVTPENIFVSNGQLQAPGLIEHMAQTIALYTGYKFYLKNQPAPTGYIGAIKKAEVFKLPNQGDNLVTTVKVLHDIMDVTLVTAEVVCNGIVCAQSEMKTILAK